MFPYSIEEFTEEVMEQLTAFIQKGGKVEFEIHVYDSNMCFSDKKLNEKGLCVLTSSQELRGDFPKLKYTATMR